MDMLVHMDPEKYGPNVVYEKVKNLIYLKVIKYIYGMPQSYLLSYNKMGRYLKTCGFKFNPYGPYVSTNITEGDPLAIVFHIDDLKASNKGTEVV